MIEDISGKSALAIDVFSISIQALKDHLIEELEKKGTTMTVKDVRWVLTVPAIWTDAAKQFMRKSAEKVLVCVTERVFSFNYHFHFARQYISRK